MSAEDLSNLFSQPEFAKLFQVGDYLINFANDECLVPGVGVVQLTPREVQALSILSPVIPTPVTEIAQFMLICDHAEAELGEMPDLSDPSLLQGMVAGVYVTINHLRGKLQDPESIQSSGKSGFGYRVKG